MDFKNPLLVWLGKDSLITEKSTIDEIIELFNLSEEEIKSKLDNFDLDKINSVSDIILNVNLKLAERSSELNPIYSFELGSGIGIPSFYLKKNNGNNVYTIDNNFKTGKIIKSLFEHYKTYFCHSQMDYKFFNPSMEFSSDSRKNSLIIMSRADSALAEMNTLNLSIANQMTLIMVPFVLVDKKNEVFCRLSQYKKICERNGYSFNSEIIKGYEPYHIVTVKPS